jgi:hydrogenase maturation protease
VLPEGSREIGPGQGPVTRDEEAPLAVLGMGNLLYSDDGAGLEALARLGRERRLPAGVIFVDGSLGGLEVAARIGRPSRLLILDAVDVGVVPGTVVRMDGPELAGLPRASGVHRLGVSDVLDVLRLTGRMPDEVVLLGIQPASIELGTRFTPEVESAVGRLVAESLAQIARWTALQPIPSRR